jgi:hypothetical protein
LTRYDDELSPLLQFQRVKRIVAVPTGLWAAIVFLDTALFVFDFAADSILRRGMRSIAFYSLPLLLYWVVFATFYSSYRVLNRRGGIKSLAIFSLIQAVAYLVFVEAGMSAPLLPRGVALTWAAGIAVVVLVAIGSVSALIALPGPDAAEAGGETVSMLIAAIFSLVIAAITYFRSDGINYVSWGVVLGVLAAAVMVKADKLTLSLLYFLDPRGASGLYHLLIVKDDVETEKSRGLREAELARLQNEQRSTSALRLANELEQELNKVTFEKGRERIQAMIDDLRSMKSSEEGEQERRVLNARRTIEQLRSHRDIPRLTAGSNLTALGDRVTAHVGLDDAELLEAESIGLISPTQRHLWTIDAQLLLGQAQDEIGNEQVRGKRPLLLSISAAKQVKSTPILLATLTEAITGTSPPSLVPVKGAESDRWVEFRFETTSHTYSAVIVVGPRGDYNVLGLVRVPTS